MANSFKNMMREVMNMAHRDIDYTPNGKGYACKDCTKYWDEVKGEWRQFKNYNLIRVA